jgi:hypothetical protein
MRCLICQKVGGAAHGVGGVHGVLLNKEKAQVLMTGWQARAQELVVLSSWTQ